MKKCVFIGTAVDHKPQITFYAVFQQVEGCAPVHLSTCMTVCYCDIVIVMWADRGRDMDSANVGAINRNKWRVVRWWS